MMEHALQDQKPIRVERLREPTGADAVPQRLLNGRAHGLAAHRFGLGQGAFDQGRESDAADCQADHRDVEQNANCFRLCRGERCHPAVVFQLVKEKLHEPARSTRAGSAPGS